VLLIVPKPLERKACAAVFDAEGVEAKPFDSHVRYRRFELHESTPSTTITMVCIQEAGNLRAARVVRDYIMAFGRPDVAVLCGMAMGITDKVALGDVVVPRQVIDYQPRRVTPAGDQLRFETYRLRDTVANDVAETADTNAADVEALFRETVARMAVHMPFPADVLPPADDQRKPFVPRIRAGALLAGEELVEDGSGPERAQMHDRIYALDMEGAGFASECEAIRLDWLIVRGIADTGEPGREKTWQAAATVAAAAFVKTFLHSGWRPDIG
jgi:nucleoside phosphorylase